MNVLNSQLFKGDTALNSCLTNDSAHLLNKQPPMIGPHIAKVQDALFLLMHDSPIAFEEIRDKRYGPSTAAVVKQYKVKFSIINRTYQQSPDDIVGKMTIEKMDKDMTALEATFPAMIQSARIGAFQRCLIAHQKIVGFGPFLPKRVDPNIVAKRAALESASNIFDRLDLELEDLDGDAPIAITVGKMKNILASPSLPTTNVPSSDPRSQLRAAFVVNNRPPIFLCVQFFGTTAEQRIRTMVHEAAHLANIGDGIGESYYSQYNCRNQPPDITVGTPSTTRRADQADTWSKFVHCVSGQPPDRENPDVIRR
jgi:hypothetical protein